MRGRKLLLAQTSKVLMRLIFIVAIICSFFSCESRKKIKIGTSLLDTPSSVVTKKYSDSLVKNEEDKVIGNIMFGISEKEYRIEKKKFENATKKQQKIASITIDEYFIGNFEYFQMIDHFDSGKLYRLEIQGTPVSWDDYEGEISNRISAIQEVIMQKFRKPEIENSIPKMYEMEKGYTYLISAWDVGTKRIEIRIQDNQTIYIPYILIYKPSIQEKLDKIRTTKKDSVNKSAKNLF
jgi:hypothetical protein